MSYVLKRTNLARRYLIATLFAALVPLILVSFLYDRYSKQLIDKIFESRIEGNLDSVAAQMNSFLIGQINRLENIVDLPDAAQFFVNPSEPLEDRLLDFLLLEAESANVYAIEFFDVDGHQIASVPAAITSSDPQKTTTPQVMLSGTEVIGPILATDDRPGWFLLRQPIFLDQLKLGSVALRMRLTSLTEQMAPLYEPDLFEPQLTVFNRLRLSPTGRVRDEGQLVQRSRSILPGWHIDLNSSAHILNQSGQNLRLGLLGVAVLLAVIISALFLQLSRRLSSYLLPLKIGAEAIARGDFSSQISENAPGELGSLAQAFNSMRQQLRGMINSRVEIERRGALGNMATGIAHEIRNPLAIVNSALFGLKSGEKSQERIEMYEVISDEIARVDNTIGEFLIYARPNPPCSQMVRVRDVFASLKTLTSSQLLEKNAALNLSGEAGLRLMIDAGHLRQILLNLILNALEVLPQDGNITLRVYRDKNGVVLDVTDNGTGMEPDVLAHCLQPFFTQRPGGTGLGLPITVELVRSNGGTLSIQSALGSGTCISMYFEQGQETA